MGEGQSVMAVGEVWGRFGDVWGRLGEVSGSGGPLFPLVAGMVANRV